MPRFIITGSGRCGTHYTNHLLNALGIPSRHELYRIGEPEFEGGVGEVGWPILGRIAEFPDTPKVALLRDPVLVVNSFYHLSLKWQGRSLQDGKWTRHYSQTFTPRQTLHDPFAFALEWVATLTTAALAACPAFVRVEDLSTPDGVLALLGGIGVQTHRDIPDAIVAATRPPPREYDNPITVADIEAHGGRDARAVLRLREEHYE